MADWEMLSVGARYVGEGFSVDIEPHQSAHLIGNKGDWVARCSYDHPPESIFTRTGVFLYGDTLGDLMEKCDRWMKKMAGG